MTRELAPASYADPDALAEYWRVGDWRPMDTAPKDGTEIVLLLHHHNRRYCRTEAEREQWTDRVRAKWIEFNGGGWTWHGMYGEPQGWKPLTVGDGQ